MSYKLIVVSVSCCSSIHSIPLIAVHVDIELGTAGIKSAFHEIGSDIHKHRVLCGISVANVLCEEPVVLWCTNSEITWPRLRNTETTKWTSPLHVEIRGQMSIGTLQTYYFIKNTISNLSTYPIASSIYILWLPHRTGTSDQLLIVSRIHQHHPYAWRVRSTQIHTSAVLITRGWWAWQQSINTILRFTSSDSQMVPIARQTSVTILK